MAKSLRSKSKRHNRTQLRKEICLPRIVKTQEIIAKKIQEDLAQKSGTSILKLKAVFQGRGAGAKATPAPLAAKEVVEEEKVVAPIVAEAQPKAKKGSKPRHNPTKTLVWFS